MKLTTNKALQSLHAMQRAESMINDWVTADQFGKVTVHSDGLSIQNAIDTIELSLELMKQFQLEVQGK